MLATVEDAGSPTARLAIPSSQSRGKAPEDCPYLRDIGDRVVRMFDTAGLGEPSGGTVDSIKAIASLYRLMLQLERGIHLLVYVIRGPRITGEIQKNYQVFWEIFCQRQVHIIVLVTGMEDEDPEKWWEDNAVHFDKDGMKFDGRACITATKGKDDRLIGEYEKSRKAVVHNIRRHCMEKPWIPSDAAKWREDVIVRVLNWFATVAKRKPHGQVELIYEALKLVGKEDREAKKEAHSIHNQAIIDLKRKRAV
jgi:hypothetical protein